MKRAACERLASIARGGARRGVFVVLALAVVSPGLTAAQDVARIARDVTDVEGHAAQLAREQVRSDNRLRSPTHVEERLIDGELFYRLKDYLRASIIFTDIVENYTRHRAFPDALFLLGDSLYRAGDYLGARTRFRQLLDRAGTPSFRPYVQRALGRLIEIAIRTRDFAEVESYFAQLSRFPPQEVEAATAYYRAKYLYNRAVPTEEGVLQAGASEGSSPSGDSAPGDAAKLTAQVDLPMLEQARQAFERVPEGTPFHAQARYFIGVVHTLRAEYPQAIEAFRRALRGRATTTDEREISELTQLALGRLYYETDQLDQAAEAYQAVSRTSENFDVALYEIAWVYIRQGDSTRAERALEVLSVAAPESRFIPDAKLLRGNLLLRNGRYDDAESVFRDVRGQFGPVRRELDEMLARHEDAQSFFRTLVRDNLEAFDADEFLPPLARRWATLEGNMGRALRVLGDLSQARQLVGETEDVIRRLNAAIGTSNAVNVFPDLRLLRQRSIGLRNRLARARSGLIQAEGRAIGDAGGELATVRARRRGIERLLGRMPVSSDDFAVRNGQLLGRYAELRRNLKELEVELMGIDARIVATDRFLADTAAQRGAEGESTQAELTQHREAVVGYRRESEELERLIEIARVQVGVGDRRYRQDDELRREYNGLVDRERQMLAQAGIGRPRQIDDLFRRILRVEGVLDRHDAVVDAVVQERVGMMRNVIDEETTRLQGYRTALLSLEGEAEVVIGGVTAANFRDVQQRFYELVLRADVGRIDVTWARREEHRMRVDMLTRERSREIQALDDEFREIMDLQQQDSSGGPQ